MNHSPRRILWVLPKYPLPAVDGARHASTILLRELKAEEAIIDLVVIDSTFPDSATEDLRAELGVDQVMLISRPATGGARWIRALKGIFRSRSKPNLAITLQPYKSEQIVNVFEAIHQGMVARLQSLGVEGDFTSLTPSWNAVVYDGLHGAAHMFDGKRCIPPENYPPIVYRAHNVESDIWLQKMQLEDALWKRRLYLWQADLVKEFELALLRKVMHVIAVSEDDRDRFQEMIPRVHGATVPIGYQFPDEIPERNPQAGHFLFVGRLDWPPNREGLCWFFDNVWPEIVARKKQCTLSVVGHGEMGVLKRYQELPGVELKGFVESLDEEYAKAEASIVPIFYGSGTRVKVIEAARHGCPVISTELGASGLGLLDDQTFLQAENVNDWMTRMTNTSSDRFKDIGSGIFQHLKQLCDTNRAAKNFLQQIEERG